MARPTPQDQADKLLGLGQFAAALTGKDTVERRRHTSGNDPYWRDPNSDDPRPYLDERLAMPDEQPQHDRAIRVMLEEIAKRTDGYFKINSQRNGKAIYFTYSFNSTQWPYHYVQYVEDGQDVERGLRGLIEKVHEVDYNRRRPSVDKFRAKGRE